MLLKRLLHSFWLHYNVSLFQVCFISAMLDNVPVLLADEDKLSPMEQSTSSNEDRYTYLCFFPFLKKSFFLIYRSLVENINYFKDEMYALREQNRQLQHRLEEEISARKRLESIMRCNLLSNRQDIEWND